MFIYVKKTREFIELNLRAFAARADQPLVLISEKSCVDYDPDHTKFGSLKPFLPETEDGEEEIHVAIFGEKFGHPVIEHTCTVHTLHEVLDLMDKHHYRKAIMISDNGIVYGRLEAAFLGDIITEFFVVWL